MSQHDENAAPQASPPASSTPASRPTRPPARSCRRSTPPRPTCSRAPACTRASTTAARTTRRALRWSAAWPTSKAAPSAFAFASGLAAISTVLELLDAGSHIVAGDDLYGGTFRLFDRVRQRSAGHRFSFVDLTDLAAVRSGAAARHAAWSWVETPTNPLLQAGRPAPRSPRICRARGIICVADNTFASPWIQRPLELGFDIVRALDHQVPERPLRRDRRHRGRRAERRAGASASASCRTRSARSPGRSTRSSPCAA